MHFKFWGTRGSIPTPGPDTVKYGGNTSCVEVEAGGQTLILDAGTGIRLLGQDILKRRKKPRELHLLITHTHWDHIQGFPYFTPAFMKDFTIRIYGCQGTGNKIEKVLSQQMDDDFFPLSFMELSASMVFTDILESPFFIGGVRVDFIFLNHPGLALGFSVSHGGKRLVYCPDVEPFRHNVLTDDSDVNINIRDYVDDLDRKLFDFVKGADCLLIDGTYTEEEYRKKPGWGHSSFLDSVRLAAEAGVGVLYLVHHDPTHSDCFVDGMMEEARTLAGRLRKGLECEGGVEGLAVTL